MTSSSGRRESSPSRRASISNGRSASTIRTIAATAAISRSPRRPRRKRSGLASSSIRHSSAFKRELVAMQPGSTIHAAATGRQFHAARQPRNQDRLPGRRHRHHAVPLDAAISPRPEGARDRSSSSTEPRASRTSPIATCSTQPGANLASGRFTRWREARERGQYPGYIDERLVRAAIPDYLERTFYISGPAGHGQGAAPEIAAPWAFAVRK